MERLPEDVQVQIFLRLHLPGIGRCGRVCRDWQAYASSAKLWKLLVNRDLFPVLIAAECSDWKGFYRDWKERIKQCPTDPHAVSWEFKTVTDVPQFSLAPSLVELSDEVRVILGPVGNTFQCWSPLTETSLLPRCWQEYDSKIRDYFFLTNGLVALTDKGTLYLDDKPLLSGLTNWSVMDAKATFSGDYLAVAEHGKVWIWIGSELVRPKLDPPLDPTDSITAIFITPGGTIQFGTEAGQVMCWQPEDPPKILVTSFSNNSIDHVAMIGGKSRDSTYLFHLLKGSISEPVHPNPFCLGTGKPVSGRCWASPYQHAVLNNRLVVWQPSGLICHWTTENRLVSAGIPLDTTGIPPKHYIWDWSTVNFRSRRPPVAIAFDEGTKDLFVARSHEGLHRVCLEAGLAPAIFSGPDPLDDELIHPLDSVENPWVVAGFFGRDALMLVTNTADGFVVGYGKTGPLWKPPKTLQEIITESMSECHQPIFPNPPLWHSPYQPALTRRQHDASAAGSLGMLIGLCLIAYVAYRSSPKTGRTLTMSPTSHSLTVSS